MKHYTNIFDLKNFDLTVSEALALKSDPRKFVELGKGKRIVMLFFNPSLRTRLSTEVAAANLGMDVTILNVGDSWSLEFEDGTVMNMDASEHVKEAARVISLYADIIGIRAFPGLKNKEEDRADKILQSFKTYADVPVISLEGSTGHPLQALADAMTITEYNSSFRPKVVLTWAPHPKPLPHAVPTSFIRAMSQMDVEFSITHPEGLALDPELTRGIHVSYDQESALQDADFVYAKNWATYEPYGQVADGFDNWMITKEKLDHAYLMHCLPVRRNVVVEDRVLDGSQSLVLSQSENRIYAVQQIIKNLLEE
ncbi:MAG: acetylornithine carbamoyltransferase [Flavobacteriaceae bacterium]|nr:acetylornithine carbamoyltransferase [Flavobacteriaceae bacterium]